MKKHTGKLALVAVIVFLSIWFTAGVIYRETPQASPTPNPVIAESKVATARAQMADRDVPAKLDKRRVTARDLGEDWPLTVVSGYVLMEDCKLHRDLLTSAHVFETESGKKYALNGFALQKGYPTIHQITKKVRYGAGADEWLYHIGTDRLVRIASAMCSE